MCFYHSGRGNICHLIKTKYLRILLEVYISLLSPRKRVSTRNVSVRLYDLLQLTFTELLSKLEFDILIGIDSIECMKKLRTNIAMNGKLKLSGSFGYCETSIMDGKIDCDFNDIKDVRHLYIYYLYVNKCS